MNETDLFTVAEWRTETCTRRPDGCPLRARLDRFRATVAETAYRQAAGQASACAACVGESCCADCAAAPVLWELSSRFTAPKGGYLH